MKGIIYLFKNKINDKPYVGQTINPKRRKREFYNINYLYTSRDLQHLSKIDKARFKYGVENFEYFILETLEADDKKSLIDLLNDKEVYYIEKYNSIDNGYNTIKGGSSYFHTRSDKDQNSKKGKSEIVVEYNSVSFLYADEYEKLDPKELFILAILKLSKSGVFPTKKVAEIAGCSHVTVKSIISKIEEKGFISITPFKGTYKYTFKNPVNGLNEELERVKQYRAKRNKEYKQELKELIELKKQLEEQNKLIKKLLEKQNTNSTEYLM